MAARVLSRARWEAIAAGEKVSAATRAARDRAAAAGLARFAALAAARPGPMLGPVRLARRLLPGGRFLAETEALLVARGQGWSAAAPHFARLADPTTPLRGSPAWAVIAPGAGAIPEPGGHLALPATVRPATLPAETAAEIVVYTAVFGRPPAPAPVFELGSRLRFLCFTDHPDAGPIPGWTLLPPAAEAPDPAADPEGARAFHKIRPEAVLAAAAPDARASLWLDPDRWLVGNPDTLFGRWLLPAEIALWRSPDGDWRAMAERHLLRGDAAPAAVLAQAEAFAAAGVPGNRGGCDTGMVWRRHGSAEAAAFAAGWWRAWQAAPGADDLALYRALAEGGAEAGGDAGAGAALPRPAILPARLGTATDNAFAARTVAGPRRRPPAAPAAGRPMPLVFLSAAAHAKSASTLLRGHQLSAMVAAAFPDRYAVSFTEDADAVRDAVVVLTKGAMVTLSPEAIARVAQRNRAAIGAWDDMRPEPEKARIVDAHLTLSHRQTIDFNRMFPETPAFHVTHHVNRLVGAMTPPTDRLRPGYFGDLDNTVRPPSLAGQVALVGINTLDVRGSEGWIATLPDYNCHWIVRRARPWDGWKPFLKGFVAARCGATVITTADDGDAAYYLGDDYPFYARSLADADLEMALVEAAAAFGGPEWRRAEEIMRGVAARATDARVLAEFDAMVQSVAG